MNYISSQGVQKKALFHAVCSIWVGMPKEIKKRLSCPLWTPDNDLYEARKRQVEKPYMLTEIDIPQRVSTK